MEKPKRKVKYDKWFLIILAILLYTLISQLFEIAPWLLLNWTGITWQSQLNLSLRVVALCIAIFGVIWVVKMYIINTKMQAGRNERTRKAIEEHPELKDIIKDIVGSPLKKEK